MVLSRDEKIELLKLEKIRKDRIAQNHIDFFYPPDGPLSRFNYPKHMRFFSAGKDYRERAMIAANRIGKTESVGGYELVRHLTGDYPDWWDGHRFTRPVSAWAVGKTNETTKDILQTKILGPIGLFGTGLIPKKYIIDYKKKATSVPDTIENVFVRHKPTGGVSRLKFKSYEQGRQSFEGTEQDIILLDEEPPADVYGECMIRTMTTRGLILLTFTPLLGISDVVLTFMPGGVIPEKVEKGKFIIQATWDDAPHLSEGEKREMKERMLPHEIEARSKGIPSLGSGAIYPIAEEDLLVDDFEIPPFWPRVYGLDFGWHNTAALWAAHDREKDVVYLTAEYKRGHAEPPVHAFNIKLQGEWIPGVNDPAKGTSQKDGESLLEIYRQLLPKLRSADNKVDAGLLDVWMRMLTGRLKVFKSLVRWREEFRLYRRDSKGKIVKDNDHLMDCMRYVIRTGLAVARLMPDPMLADKILAADRASYDPLTWGLN